MLHWLTHNTNGKWQASSLQVPEYSLLIKCHFLMSEEAFYFTRFHLVVWPLSMTQKWSVIQRSTASLTPNSAWRWFQIFFPFEFQEYTCISLLIYGTVPIGKFGNTFVNLFLKLGKKWNLEIGKSDQLSQEFGGLHAMCCLDHIHLLALPLI